MSDAPREPGWAARFRGEAARARSELGAARGLGGTTYAALADRGAGAIEAFAAARIDASLCAGIGDAVRLVRSAARLLEDASAGEVPPMNDEVYAASVRLSEAASLAEHAARLGPRWRAGIEAWLRADAAGDDDASARHLGLSFGALCRRGGLPATPAGGRAEVDVEIDGWPVVGVCVDAAGPDWLARALERVVARGRPAMVVIEAGPLIPPMDRPRAVAGDADASGVAAARIDAVLAAHQEAWAEAIGDELAFAVVARATLPVVNAASGRVLLVESFRWANLCALADPRIAKLRRFGDALSRAAG